MKKIVFITLGLLISYQLWILPKSTKAVLSSCAASVSPTTVNTSTSQGYSFSVSSASGILWIKITRPSTNFTINSASGSGWNSSVSDSSVTFTPVGQSGGSGTVTVTATSGSSEASSADWAVQASDDSGGASPTTCTGTLGTAISGAGADTTAPTISDIVVSDVTSSAVKITWTTNENSSTTIDYGTTDSYGSTATGSSSVTSHSVSIDSLSANTTYHYNVKSADSSSNEAESGDNTFVTAKTGTTGTTTTGTTTTTTVTKTVTITKTIKDDTPPTIFLDTDFDKPYTEPPQITGLAKDSGDVNPGISRVEYSFDDGKTWLEVDSIKSPNARSTTFNFVPAIFEDGNFKLKVRAYDNSGNATSSRVNNLIIDRLPPQIGGILFSIGPQVTSPGKGGVLIVPEGLDIKITLSSVGGALTIDLFADAKTYSLIKNPDSGLWSGTLNFPKSGEYTLKSKSIDGAGNIMEKDLIRMNVLKSGRVFDESDKVTEGAVVSVYYFEPSLAQFVLWDGKPFGQDNPQKVREDGRYKLLLPSGKYYLQISKFGYKTIKTNIFTIEDNIAVTSKFVLKKSKGIQLGPIFIPFFDFTSEQIDLTLNLPGESVQANKLAGRELPYFTFNREESEVNTNSFKGKPTVLTFSATWSPKNAEQMYILQKLGSKKEINTIPVLVQETISRVSIFEKTGHYSLQILADPDGELFNKLSVFNLPTHVFLDRKGVIKKIVPGVLTEGELLENLVN